MSIPGLVTLDSIITLDSVLATLHPDVTYMQQAYLSCKLAGSVKVLQTDPTLSSNCIELPSLLSKLGLKGAAALNAQQALGVCKAQAPQLRPHRAAVQQ